MNTKSAILSFSIASLIPVIFSVILGNYSDDWVSNLILFSLFYIIYFVVVMLLGFLTLIFALKIKFGPIFLPPLVGGIFGFLVSKFTYNPGTTTHSHWWFIIDGIMTATLAALIYFRAWPKSIVK